jgi:L-lactate dehydrogenase (cytochrome)|eukprot:COSAG01_NODE_2215_length_8133_cov_7.016880_6_plen_81_part_00
MPKLSEDPAGEPRGSPLISFEEIARHTTKDDCWVVVEGVAYDVTSFLPDHPGGAGIILEAAGRDSTAEFLEAHPVAIMKV